MEKQNSDIPTYQPNDFIVRFGDVGKEAIWMQVRALDRVTTDDGESMEPSINPIYADTYALYRYDTDADRWDYMTESATVGPMIGLAVCACPSANVTFINIPGYLKR